MLSRANTKKLMIACNPLSFFGPLTTNGVTNYLCDLQVMKKSVYLHQVKPTCSMRSPTVTQFRVM